jgi:hypothetical protein
MTAENIDRLTILVILSNCLVSILFFFGRLVGTTPTKHSLRTKGERFNEERQRRENVKR